MFPLPNHIGRRTFVTRSGLSLGAMAAASLLDQDNRASANDSKDPTNRWTGVIQPFHVPPKAKRVIWLYMAGGMTHLDTFDYKEKLAEMHGKPMPESITKGQQIAQLQGAQLNCFGPQHPFKKWGQSGQMISEIWPHLGKNVLMISVWCDHCIPMRLIMIQHIRS